MRLDETNTWLIENVADFEEFVTNSYYAYGNYKLMTDINMSDTKWRHGINTRQWLNKPDCILDGNNKKIRNLRAPLKTS